VVETNHYYQWYLVTLDEGHSVAGDIVEVKLFVLLETTIQYNMAVDEVVLFRGVVVVKNIFPKNTNVLS